MNFQEHSNQHSKAYIDHKSLQTRFQFNDSGQEPLLNASSYLLSPTNTPRSRSPYEGTSDANDLALHATEAAHVGDFTSARAAPHYAKNPTIHPNELVCRWHVCHNPVLQCGIAVETPEALYEHLTQIHIGRKAYGNLNLVCQWDGCGAKAAKRDHATSHMRVHVPLRPHACPVCGRAFKRSYDLKKHITKLHPEASATKSLLPKVFISAASVSSSPYSRSTFPVPPSTSFENLTPSDVSSGNSPFHKVHFNHHRASSLSSLGNFIAEMSIRSPNNTPNTWNVLSPPLTSGSMDSPSTLSPLSSMQEPPSPVDSRAPFADDNASTLRKFNLQLKHRHLRSRSESQMLHLENTDLRSMYMKPPSPQLTNSRFASRSMSSFSGDTSSYSNMSAFGGGGLASTGISRLSIPWQSYKANSEIGPSRLNSTPIHKSPVRVNNSHKNSLILETFKAENLMNSAQASERTNASIFSGLEMYSSNSNGHGKLEDDLVTAAAVTNHTSAHILENQRPSTPNEIDKITATPLFSFLEFDSATKEPNTNDQLGNSDLLYSPLDNLGKEHHCLY